LPSLFEIFIRNNELSGAFPNINAPILRTLNFSGNKLSGIVPNLALPQLTRMILDNNEFTSFAPTFKYYYLRDISVAKNKLSGEISNLITPNLNYLNLDSNQITSIIPNANFTDLGTLNLRHNLLRDFPKLTYMPRVNLGLEYNQLEGCIPNDYKQLCNLQRANLSNNPKLAWGGDFSKFCSEPSQTNAPCNDNDPTTIDDKINTNCECVGKVGIFSSNTAPCLNDTVHYVIKQNLAGTFQWKTIPDGFIQGNDKDYKKVIVKNTGQAVELILWNTVSNTTVTTTTITPYASSAGTMTAKFLQTTKTNKTITVKHFD
jgi:Leucine-rich repeat (LRR) protein